MRKYIIALCFLCGASLQAQTNVSKIFVPPFDFPLYLSGNFGELRSNHFHGGIDFKTESVEGKPIHCIADGYISRISVSTGGYGNALYVTHTNGYTSVYGHLKTFTKQVADLVEKYQYEHQTFAVELTPDSLIFPCRQGQIIALSGNTGFSFGPHLHMEIRKTSTEEN
ncbi:MAG: M23 family metallopeptidase, partial [Bacteroidaceae bacterium]